MSPTSYNLVETLPFYIRDSKHFLHLLESLRPLPENAVIVTADVTSLYTNIPHEEGIESVLQYIRLYADTYPQVPRVPTRLVYYFKLSSRITTFHS